MTLRLRAREMVLVPQCRAMLLCPGPCVLPAQMMGFLFRLTLTSSPGWTDVMNFVSGAVGLQLALGSSASLGFCASHTLQAVTKVVFEAFVPLLVGVAMVLCCATGFAVPSLRAWLFSEWRPPSWCLRVQMKYRYSRHNAKEVRALLAGDVAEVAPAAPLYAVDDHFLDDARQIPLRARLFTACVSLFLFAHSVMLSSMIKLLHCVDIAPGLSQRLFLQASVSCAFGGWQLIPLVVFIALVAVPFALPVLARWSMGVGGDAFTDDVRTGMKRAFAGMFDPLAYWWESVLMLHRVVLAALYIFGSQHRGTQAVGAACVCLLALLCHVLVRPLRNPAAQRFQTLVLSCLCAVAVCVIPSAQSEQLGAATTPSALACAVYICCGFLLPLAAFLFSTWRKSDVLLAAT